MGQAFSDTASANGAATPAVLCERVGDVLVIRINSPQKLNAASTATADAILSALGEAGDARAIVLTGDDRAFCSGADLSLRMDGPLAEGATYLALSLHYNPLILAMADSPLPVVSAVNGPAAGIGCSLALAADFCVAGEKAYFLQAFVNIGLVPDGGSTWMLPRLIGKARATEMMMLGERVPGPKAMEWGLIHRCVPDAEVFDTALALATRLAAGPTATLGAIKHNLNHAVQVSGLSETLVKEAEAQHRVAASQDAREGAIAFMEKRKPVFKGC